MRNVRLDICYDGTRYKGWQRLQGNDQTIQAKLEMILSRLLDEPIEVSASGRTDAGTHALGQVVSFRCNNPMPCEEILQGLRQFLPEDIGVYRCKNVSERFHARLNAKSKTYRYRVWNSETPCVFDRKYVYMDCRTFDLNAMVFGAKHFIGTHDFSAFCGNKNMKKSTVRTIESFTVERQGNEIVFLVKGNGFLQHMVRIMVGTLLEIGVGERSAEDIPKLFGGLRSDAGVMVPACGLCLMEVIY
ncbi:MAG: tRNA pseudouridine(38-40) synthase TruA [Oscillospiraceae bacterium]|nr:tRNA pseudouridine(38-40) synthase TruA [Oscillospiraceae bacterium]